MLAHHVLFWLKDDATDEEIKTFHQALLDLKTHCAFSIFSCRNTS